MLLPNISKQTIYKVRFYPIDSVKSVMCYKWQIGSRVWEQSEKTGGR